MQTTFVARREAQISEAPDVCVCGGGGLDLNPECSPLPGYQRLACLVGRAENFFIFLQNLAFCLRKDKKKLDKHRKIHES